MRKTSTSSLVRRTNRAQLAGAIAAPSAAALALALAVPSPSSAAYPPSAEGTRCAATTDNADATRAAIDVMASGGNAVDGAIAAALTLGVVLPSASGMGGGGFALVYTAKDKKIAAYDFRETAPARFSADVLWPHEKGKPAAPPANRWAFAGPRGGSVGVPGEPAGLELLSKKYGKKSLAEDASRAATLAENGFILSRHMADVVAAMKDRIAAAPPLAAAFLPGGRPALFASRVRRPDLAATLRRFGAEGKRSIYEGPTAQKIVASANAAGGALELSDLAGYTVKERAPLTRTFDKRTVYTMPAPSAGGLMMMEALSMYGANESSPLAAMGFGSSAYLHTVAEVMRGAFADRARFSTDPDLDPGVDAAYAAALAPAQMAARKARIDPNKTHAPADFKTREQGTSHLVVADAEGNVVSMTTTVNGGFGSSVVAGDTGILLNNELDDFSAPEDVKPFGVADGGPNRPRPNARPVSSMAPTIVVEDGAPILAFGGSGGTRIATEVTQAALARLVFHLDPVACVSHPRIHTQGVDLIVDHEIPLDVRKGLEARGEKPKEEPFAGSALEMIAWERGEGGARRMLVAADPRKAGLAAAR